MDAFGEYETMRAAAGMHVVDAPGVIHAVGPDALTYLQSILSQDLAPLGAGQGAHALLLQPQGKLEADLRVSVVGPDDVWIDCVDAPSALAALNRFKIRVDVAFEDVSAESVWLAVRGPASDAAIAETLGVMVPGEPYGFVLVDGCRYVRAVWPGIAGVDVVGPRDAVGKVADALSLVVVGDSAFERLRIECGVPMQGVDMDETTIPQEAFLERDAISFTKGCFLGQELVCRIDSRGHVNRLLRIVELPAIVAPGTELVADGKGVGTITSVAATPEGAIGLALVRHELEPGAAVRVGDGTGRVRALP